MIVVLKQNPNPAQLDSLIAWLEEKHIADQTEDLAVPYNKINIIEYFMKGLLPGKRAAFDVTAADVPDFENQFLPVHQRSLLSRVGIASIR